MVLRDWKLQEYILDRDEAVADVPEFIKIYEKRPLRNNDGGMGFNHSFATWHILKNIAPATVIESGVWRGHSTWLIEQACPNAEIFCLDIDFSKLEYKSDQATYIEADVSECDWSSIDPTKAVAFLDDHQNAYARLKDLWWIGIHHAIFEDNYAVGEGDCYSLKHVRAGVGLPHLQMSPHYQGNILERAKRKAIEKILMRLKHKQTAIVRPNTSDLANLQRRLKSYLEFPPVVRYPAKPSGENWEGSSATVAPLFENLSSISGLDRIEEEEPGKRFGYSYIAYVSLI